MQSNDPAIVFWILLACAVVGTIVMRIVFARQVKRVRIADIHWGLLVRHGKVERVLEPGDHSIDRSDEIAAVDRRPWSVSTGMQAATSVDGRVVQFSVMALLRISDPLLAVRATDNPRETATISLARAAFDHVRTHQADDLRASPAGLVADVTAALVERFQQQGIAIDEVAVTSLLVAPEPASAELPRPRISRVN